MPMTPWNIVAGHICELCRGLATHEHKGMWICCQCHAGGGPDSGWIPQELAKEYHAEWNTGVIHDDIDRDFNQEHYN